MKTPKLELDLDAEFKAAWDREWHHKQKRLEIFGTFRGEHTYLTASDLERSVREAAIERTGSWRVRISTGSRFTTLLAAARNWLARQPHLEMATMGKGHISGARYRPRGVAPSEAELKTTAKRQAYKAGLTPPKPVHYAKSWGAQLLCVDKKRSSWRSRRHFVRTTTEPEAVTCPRCQKRLKQDEHQKGLDAYEASGDRYWMPSLKGED